MALDFLQDAANTVLVGSNGADKSMVAQNIAYPPAPVLITTVRHAHC